MATNITTPSAPTGAFEPPPTAAELQQSRKEVSWSATPKEIDQETIKKRKMPITYSIAANLRLTTVIKTTLTMLQLTDPMFILISNVDSTVNLKNAAGVDTMPESDLKRFFPARIASNNKVHCKLFFLAMMPIHRLKKATFGFYAWAGQKYGYLNHTQQTFKILDS
jgi:hypothetical protein